MRQQDGWLETDTNPVIYLTQRGNKVQALSAICPHLGCTVPWDVARKEFVCPCHGGAFGPDGSYRSGPPRRGMDVLRDKGNEWPGHGEISDLRPDVPNKEVTS